MRRTWLPVFGLIVLSLGLLAPGARAEVRLEVSEAPATNLAMTTNAIRSARRSILLNIYELSSAEIADAIAERVAAGVHVEILAEGQPVGGLSPAAKGIRDRLAQAMRMAGNGDRFFVMSSKAVSAQRRFRFDHAKYAVVDGTNLLIGSENYSPTGNPEPGTVGNRGWEVFVHDASIAAAYQAVFRADADPSQDDIRELTGNSALPPAAAGPFPAEDPEPPGREFGVPLVASSITKLTSPESSLSGLLGIVNDAISTLDIEQMIFDSGWLGGTNPLIGSIRDAAARGVKVRVLLNDETVFSHGKPRRQKNVETAQLLNGIPNVTARIANVAAMGVDFIHNKGVLADGKLTLISSINWDENSIERNREAAVLIEGADVFRHYEALFETDWSASAMPSDAGEPFHALSLPDLPGTGRAAECPRSLDVSIHVGSLAARDDDSFASLANTTVSGRLQKAPASACSYGSDGASTETFREHFLDLRPNGDKSITFVFEGYTPRGKKIYTIRAKRGADALFANEFTAGVFNGSATREFLGLARVRILGGS